MRESPNNMDKGDGGSQEISDGALGALLKTWQVGPAPLSLRAHTIARMSLPTRGTSPFPALRFQTAGVALALLIGVLTGSLLPSPRSRVDTVQIVANLW